MKKLIKKIIIGVVILVVGIVVYNFIFKKESAPAVGLTSSNPAPTSAESPLPEGDSVVGAQFLSILLNLKNIKLDDSLFASPTFSGLQDFTINLVQEGNQGRNNPFAPLGVDPSLPNPAVPPTSGTNTPPATVPSTH